MPPRAQRLYPRMRERPPEFRVNPAWPLFASLVVCDAVRNEACNIDVVNNVSGQVVGGSNLVFNSSLRRIMREYDGNDDRVDYGAHFRACPTTQLTAMCFVQLYTRSGYHLMVETREASSINRGGYVMQYTEVYSPAGFRFWLWNGSSWTGVGCGIANAFQNYHICLSWSAATSTMRGYVDGKLVASQTATSLVYVNPLLTLGKTQFTQLSEKLFGQMGDVLIFDSQLSDAVINQVADPSNVDLRIGGVPLILPPRRRLWPVAPVAEAVFLKRRSLGLRAGTREAVI